MKMSRNFFVAEPLRKVEVGFTSCNGDCNKNIARHVHFRVCHTAQRFVLTCVAPGVSQPVQRNCETSCKTNCLVYGVLIFSCSKVRNRSKVYKLFLVDGSILTYFGFFSGLPVTCVCFVVVVLACNTVIRVITLLIGKDIIDNSLCSQ